MNNNLTTRKIVQRTADDNFFHEQFNHACMLMACADVQRAGH